MSNVFAPSSPGGTSGQLQWNNGGRFGGVTISGDAVLNTTTGVMTVTASNGVAFGTMAFQNATAVAITGGTIDGTTVGATTASTGKFTMLSVTGTGAASASPLMLSGTLFTGGTGTTTFPYIMAQPTGATAATGWAVGGTLLGLNAPSGFAGNLIDCRLNGGSTAFAITSSSAMTLGGAATFGASVTLSSGASGYKWTGRCQILTPADGIIELVNNAGTGFTRLQLGGTTSSFPAIKVNAAALNFRLADDSADTSITASNLGLSGTVTSYSGVTTAGRGVPSTVAVVTLTAQTAAIAATTAYTATAAGVYRVSYVATITTTATISSALGGANGFQIKYTNSSDSVVKTTNPTTPNISGANATTTSIGGSQIINASAASAIQYIMGYTSSGVTPMAYDLVITVEAM